MKVFKKFAWLALVTFSVELSAAALSLAQMNEDEQKQAGIEKLTPEEKQALDAWLAKQTSAKEPVMQKNKIIHGEFSITGNQSLGRFISLDNGMTYEIPSRSRKKTMAWKVGEKVRLVEPVYPTNYKLENILHNQTIGGKIAKPAPIQPTDTPQE